MTFSSLTQMIVAMKHEKRRFVEKVDFITSPGFLGGGDSRRDAGLIAGGMFKVVTDLAVMGFDHASKKMKVEALHAGVTAEQVQDNTGFDLMFDDGNHGDRSADEPGTRGPERAGSGASVHRLRHLFDRRFIDGRRKRPQFGIAMRNFTAYPELPDAEALIAYGERMEELGYESLWVWDHVVAGAWSRISLSSSR